MLRERGAHQQAAVRLAEDRQFLRRGVFALDQVPRRRGKIVEHVLLFCEIAGKMPGLAELAAAADDRDRINPAAVEPSPRARAQKAWPHADAVAAIAVEDGRVVAVEHGALLADDIDRHLGAVLRRRRLDRHLHVIEAVGSGISEFGFFRRLGRVIPARHIARPQIAAHRVDQAAVRHCRHLADRGRRRQRKEALRLAVVIEDAHPVGAADRVAHHQVRARQHDRVADLHRDVALRHHHRSGRQRERRARLCERSRH